jgi:allantoinase
VNPPLRGRDDVEKLWEHLLAGNVDWVVSDHACCKEATKFGEDHEDVFAAKSGFGGTEYLLPGLVGEGRSRGLPLRRVAELTAWNPAQRYGLAAKGDIAEGFDADIALVDPDRSWVVGRGPGGFLLHPGVHAAARARDRRQRDGYLPARPAGLRRRQDPR